jgi:hypothetical protein
VGHLLISTSQRVLLGLVKTVLKRVIKKKKDVKNTSPQVGAGGSLL